MKNLIPLNYKYMYVHMFSKKTVSSFGARAMFILKSRRAGTMTKDQAHAMYHGAIEFEDKFKVDKT